MKVSELITRLEIAKANVGDIEVFISDPYTHFFSMYDVNWGIHWHISDDPVINIQAYVFTNKGVVGGTHSE